MAALRECHAHGARLSAVRGAHTRRQATPGSHPRRPSGRASGCVAPTWACLLQHSAGTRPLRPRPARGAPRMITRSCLLFALLFAASPRWAPAADEAPAPVALAPPDDAPISTPGFAPGEEIVFDIDYLSVRMGRASLRVGEPEGAIWPVICRGQTDGIASLFDIREHYVSYWDADTGVSRGNDLNAIEGGDRHTDRARFDRENGVATVQVMRKGKVRERTHEVPRDVHDLASALLAPRPRPPAPPPRAGEAACVAGGREGAPAQTAVRPAPPRSALSATAEPLEGPSRVAPALYRVVTLELSRPSGPDGEAGSWPDPLVPVRDPFFGERRRAFRVAVAAGELQAIWVELCVPQDARPGRYRGAVRLDDGGGSPAAAAGTP